MNYVSDLQLNIDYNHVEQIFLNIDENFNGYDIQTGTRLVLKDVLQL